MDDCNHGVAHAADGDHRCSDSSMDDCNLRDCRLIARLQVVQIPLWTIVTSRGSLHGSLHFVQIPLWTIVTNSARHALADGIYVQIPLWTIVTGRDPDEGKSLFEFRFLYGRL